MSLSLVKMGSSLISPKSSFSACDELTVPWLKVLENSFKRRSIHSRGRLAEIFRKSPKIRQDGDLITTRILRLRGLEKGVNKGEGIDTYKRFVYIHGTRHEWLIGKPASYGCVRMRNKDIVKLFDIISSGTEVFIEK